MWYYVLCNILLKLCVKIPVYTKLDGTEYIFYWYISWWLLKLVQSATSQLCEDEKCLHLFWINVWITLNRSNLDSVHLLNGILSHLFGFFLLPVIFLPCCLFKILGYNDLRKIPACEQIVECKVHIMQKDSGRVVGVAVSLSLLPWDH